MDALFANFSEEEMLQYFTEDYIQHNPGVPTGRAPVVGILPVLRDADFGYTLHRIIEDGDLVLTHTTYHNAQLFGAETVIAFDIWRVEGDRVAEHWDCITPVVADPVGGRTQSGGPTEVTDVEHTERNKALVEGFVNEILIAERWGSVSEFVREGRYEQHNPMVEDGLEALRDAMKFLKAKKVHRVIGEGNFAMTHTEGDWDGKPHVSCDLFRIENGVIVEHWDVIQEIPSEMAHENGMF